MNTNKLLVETQAQLQQVIDKIKNLDDTRIKLEEQRQLLLQEALRLEGALRVLNQIIEEDKNAKAVDKPSVEPENSIPDSPRPKA